MIPGYLTLGTLHTGNASVIRRVRRQTDGCVVLLKQPRSTRPPRELIERYQHEFELLTYLDGHGTVRVYGMEQDGARPVLVLEEFVGPTLLALLQRERMDVDERLVIAAELAAALARLHAGGIVHKALRPNHILYDRAGGVIKLIDFSHAARFATDLQRANVSDLRYVAPEQTGRMKRPVDQRSDLYSLGVVLYELLCGAHPFPSRDPLALAHAHIAQQPAPPQQHQPRLPTEAAAIVMRLLAKSPEERYQSATGVQRDLEACLARLRGGGADEVRLGAHDIPDRLVIPQALFGREAELQFLLECFGRIGPRHKELLLLGGYAGIGKSALVQGLQEAVAGRRAWYVSGRCDPHERNRPYSAFVGALRELIKHLLSEPETRLQQWRAAILAAIGANGRLLIDLVPEAELVIGPQPVAAAVTPEGLRSVFKLVLPRFIRVFCRSSHPLLIHLDDLQWADSASLNLLEVLMRDPELGYLFVIGAYRENALSEGHGLLELAETLADAGVEVQKLRLDPLGQEHVTALVAGALHAEPGQVSPLAELIHRKTGGNPFFAGQLLRDLHDQGLVAFDHAGGGWQWDLAAIHGAAITDNLVELMAARIRRLDEGARRLLGEAACIGSAFSLRTLQLTSHCPAQALRELLEEGMLLALGDVEAWLDAKQEGAAPDVRFAHERVRQAAYELLPEPDRLAHHLAIGRALLAALPPERRAEQAFELAGQLNRGASLIADPTEREELARLNLVAAERSKAASAFEPALHYLEAALRLLGPWAWQRQYELQLSLSVQAAEAAYLCGDFQRMEELAADVIAHAHLVRERVPVYVIKIQACMFNNELQRALDIGLDVLAQLGVRFPARPHRGHILLALFKTRLSFAGKNSDQLLDLPMMTDPHAQAVLRVLARMGSAAYIVQPNLHPLLIFKVLSFARRYGNSAEYTFAYATYSLLLSAIVGDVDRGHAFGRLALDLVEKTGARQLEARTVVLVNLFTRHWKEPVRATLAPLKQAYRSGLASGDFEYATYGIAGYLMGGYLAGVPLAEIDREARRYLSSLDEMNQGTGRSMLLLTHQCVLNLLGQGGEPARLAGKSYDERTMQFQQAASREATLRGAFHVHKLILAYLTQAYPEACYHADEARRHLDGLRSMLLVPVFHFYDSLAQLSQYGSASLLQRRRIRVRVADNQRKMKRWALGAPANFLHKYKLVEAERARLRGDRSAALAAYERAAALAARADYVQEEALACELAASFHAREGRARIAAMYRRSAAEAYRRWGCEFLALRAEVERGRERDLPDAGLAELTPSQLDLSALKKALKGIAAENIHSRMIEHIIRAAVEFTGAQSGHLLLRKPSGELCVEAEWHIDEERPIILQGQWPEDNGRLSLAVINYVRRTRESVVIHDARRKHPQIPQLHHDAYVRARNVRSILCMPIVTGGAEEAELNGLLYVENNRLTRAFTGDAFQTLEIIGLSAAGRLELSRKAATDGLTGLYNHDYFRTILNKEFQQARRKSRPLSLAMVDIDHFKQFNDSWGHQAGDHVLREVTLTIQSCCRESDTAARYGGEEIALILPETDAATALSVTERIRAQVAAQVIVYNGQQMSVTVSIGIASLTDATLDHTMLLKRADEALYSSKREGRNRVSAA